MIFQILFAVVPFSKTTSLKMCHFADKTRDKKFLLSILTWPLSCDHGWAGLVLFEEDDKVCPPPSWKLAHSSTLPLYVLILTTECIFFLFIGCNYFDSDETCQRQTSRFSDVVGEILGKQWRELIIIIIIIIMLFELFFLILASCCFGESKRRNVLLIIGQWTFTSSI